MNAIVMNTLTGAVSEYSNFQFDGITETHAGNADGLVLLEGNRDLTTPVVATVSTGSRQWGKSLKKMVDMVYFAIIGTGTSTLTVAGERSSFDYPFPLSANGESRAKPGKGIRENYLSFTYSNTDGADFQLDAIEIEIGTSVTRRTQ